MYKQSTEHVLHDGGTTFRRAITALVMALVLAACTPQQVADAKARIGEQKIVDEICSLWQPITDTTSKQVRGMNRARHSFCESPTN